MNTHYLDNAATTPLLPEVKEYLASIIDDYSNPSANYKSAHKVRNMIEKSRQNVAEFINANPSDVYFTPNGSASNTLAIRGYYNEHKDSYILYSPTAHKSMLECAKHLVDSSQIPVDRQGFLDMSYLEEWFTSSSSTKNILVALEYANSEIGTVQHVKDIIEIVHFYGGLVYLDCTGSISQIKLDVSELDVDMIGFSAHKIGAMKGCGVLYKKPEIKLQPLIYGNQESGLIGGTENVFGIASLGKAVELMDYSNVDNENAKYVYDYFKHNIPKCYLIGAALENCRLPHNLYMCFKGIEAEVLVFLADLNGIQLSTGSACNNITITSSPTLSAIRLNEEDLRSCVRMTFNGKETKEELDYVCNKLNEIIEQLRGCI